MRALQLAIKRGMDIAVGAVGLLLASPLLAALAALVYLDSAGPIFFKQRRSGRNGIPFNMYKFRTMYVGAVHFRNPDGSAYVGRVDPRVTRLGKFLREFSLDELPQFWNILVGQMSLVGPRPEKPDYTSELPEWARQKLEMRPGCLSLPLISGRNELSWQARNELDLRYVRDYSLWLDLKIIALGAWHMLITRRGVYSPDACAPEPSPKPELLTKS